MASRSRDLVATLLVVAIEIPYIGYLLRGEMPHIEDARGMAGVGLLLGLVAFFVATEDVPRTTWMPLMTTALVSFGLGLLALVFAETAAAGILLALFMGSIVVVWFLAMTRYLRGDDPARLRLHEHAHAGGTR